MKRHGLVLGKFMPLHMGHLALIDFARARCEHLTVLLCAQDDLEPIPGEIRRQWLAQELGSRQHTSLHYTNVKLPNTSESSQAVSAIWGQWIKENLPPVDIFFSSEPYGEYLAEYLEIDHQPFDPARSTIPVSGTQIRQFPQRYWEYLAHAAKPYFLGRIALVGTESTGKSTLAAQLAAHFGTLFVPEQARTCIPDSQKVTWNDLYTVAEAQTKAILEAEPFATRLLFSDTDLRTTEVYGQFLFGQIPDFAQYHQQLRPFDLTFLLDCDVPFVQDGSRLEQTDRNALHQTYVQYFVPDQQSTILLSGDWQSRFQQAIQWINHRFQLPG